MFEIPDALPAEWVDMTWETKDGPVNIGILELVLAPLKNGPKTHDEIVAESSVTGPERVSKALGLLREAGLVVRDEHTFRLVGPDEHAQR